MFIELLANYLCDIDEEIIPTLIPDVLPVSIRDVEHLTPLEMDQHMQDPCPNCGAFRMLVGDYVCWGTCMACYDIACNELHSTSSNP